jgi:hypothetical protein
MRKPLVLVAVAALLSVVAGAIYIFLELERATRLRDEVTAFRP